MTAPIAVGLITVAISLLAVVACFGPARDAREAVARWIGRLFAPGTGRHGVRRDTWTREAAATLRHPVASLHLWLHWWDWPVVQAYWHRQYKRADRRAFAAEMASMRPHEDAPVPYRPAYLPAPAPTPAATVPPSVQPDAAPCIPPQDDAATLPQPAFPGLGQPPGRDTWVRHAPRHAATQPRVAPIETTPLYDELIAVTDGTGPRAVIWPQAAPSARTTGTLPALGDLPPVPVRRCSTDVAAFGDSLIAGLRAL